MQRPERIASPVNRTQSFEIAISTSPPLSPAPPQPPPHGASLSPSPAFRRNVHETILRETREYMIHTSRPVSFPDTSSAPIAEPESTSSLRTVSPEVVVGLDKDKSTVIDDHFDEVADDENNDDRRSENDNQIEVIDEPQLLQVERLEGAVSTQSLEPPQERPIVFPITPFYRRKGSKFCKCSAWLGVLCALFFLLSIGLLIAWAVTTGGFRTIGSKMSNICQTRQCIDMAFRMSSSVDEMIEPCDNFYQYSCRKFNTNSNGQESFLSVLRENSFQTIHSLLTAEKDSKTLPNSANLARTLFDQCMNAIQRSTNAPSDLLNFIKNFPCGPILKECHSFNADTYSWERHAGMLDWYAGDLNLIVYSRDVHPQDRSRIILQIKPPNLLIQLGPVIRDLTMLAQPSSAEFDPLLLLSIRQNILTPLVRDELRQDPHGMQKELDEVASLFVDLYRATRESTMLTPNTTYMTFGEMFKAMPQLYLREFLDAQLTNVYKWQESDMISIQDYDYFARLVDIMAKTSRKTTANYLVIVTVLNLDQYSYSPKEQFGWRECVEQLSNLEIVDKMYIEAKQTDLDREKTSEFLQNLKTNFISTHRSSPMQYLSEINRLGFYLGFPTRLQNEELVWKPVSQVALNKTDYFDSIVKVSKAERDYKMAQIGTYLDNDDTTQFPITIPDMLYNPHVGGIIIPLAFLEPPIYTPGDQVPMYGIYSSIGITVLQMISKIFWQGLDKSAQIQCFDNIYRGFLNSSGQRAANIEPQLLATIDLADAFKTSLYAYTKWQSDHHLHNEKSLPSFDNYDSMKSLMLTFSTLFCNGEGAEPGSDYEAMINTVVSNSRMFSVHFQCSNSTRLYNRRTCI